VIARTAFMLACVLTGAAAVAQQAPAIQVPEYPIPEDNAWDYMVRAGYLAHISDRSAPHELYFLRGREPTADELRAAAEAYQPAFAILREGLYLPCRVPEVALPALEPIVPPERAMPPPPPGPVAPPGAVGEPPPPAPPAEMVPPAEEIVGGVSPAAHEPPPPEEWVEQALESGEWTHEQAFRVCAWLRELSRGLMWEAQSRVADGHPDEAIDSVQDGLRMARNLTINGTVIHQLVSIAISAITTSSLDRVLTDGQPSPERLIAFAQWNEQNRAEWQPLSATIAIEAVQHQRWIREVVVPAENQYVAEAMAWANRPAHSRGVLADPPWQGHDLTLGGAERWARFVQKYLLNDASLAGMSVRCALEAYRQREGVWPTALDALAPDYLAEVPEDPCSGEAFRYVLTRRDGTGACALYSVGLDGKDDAGELVFNSKDGLGDILIAPRWDIHENR